MVAVFYLHSVSRNEKLKDVNFSTAIYLNMNVIMHHERGRKESLYRV